MSPVPTSKPKKNKQKSKKRTGAPVGGVPVAIGGKVKSSEPRVRSNRAGSSVYVSHREFVGSLSNGATTGFALTPISAATPGYDFNPACSTLFPWLSLIAPSFERFRFTNLSFRFVPSSPTTTAGRFYAAIDYDYDDNVAGSKAQLMTNTSAVEVPVWMEAKLPAITAQLHRDQPFKYVSTNVKSNFVEPRTAYCGYLMCAFDTPTANLLYDLWVDYTIEFQLPVGDVPVNLVTAPVVQPVANVASVGTGATKYGLASIVPVVNAALKVVAPGNGITPILDLITSPGVGSTMRPDTAYDIRGCRKQSLLEMDAEWNETGSIPANILTGDVALYAFDAIGKLLGYVVPSSSQAGAKIASQIGVASAYVRQISLYHLEDVLTQFATAAFLTAMVGNPAGALGAGNIGIGTKFEY